MAQNITLLGASYSDVPAVTLPKTGGGTASFTDVTDTTAAAADVASGKYFYTSAGVRTQGTASGGGGISMDDFATSAEPSGDVIIPNATTIARNVFQYRNNMRSVYSASVTKIEASAFNTNTGIQTIDFPNVTTLNGSAVFAWSTNLVSVSLPKLSVSNQTNLFQGDTKLEFVDFGFGTNINTNVFATCNKFRTLILRRTGAVCALANVNAFTNTPFRGYNSLTGTVYVPNALISTYKTATNWKTMYDAGTCNFVAIEGSQYE